jgi:hypothetical protein
MNVASLVWCQVAEKITPSDPAFLNNSIPAIIFLEVLSVIPVKRDEAIFGGKASKNTYARGRIEASERPYLSLYWVDT